MPMTFRVGIHRRGKLLTTAPRQFTVEQFDLVEPARVHAKHLCSRESSIETLGKFITTLNECKPLLRDAALDQAAGEYPCAGSKLNDGSMGCCNLAGDDLRE